MHTSMVNNFILKMVQFMKDIYAALKVDFHSVQFIERAEFCDRFLLKCVQSAIFNEIRST